MLKSKESTLSKIPSKLVITNSQPGLMLSTKDFLDSRCLEMLKRSWVSPLSLMSLPSQLPLTGELRVKSTQLKTKANVVHVGLSRQLPQLKVLMPSRLEHSFLFLNNNLLIVTNGLKVAMVDGNHGLCNISKQANKILRKTTFTKL